MIAFADPSLDSPSPAKTAEDDALDRMGVWVATKSGRDARLEYPAGVGGPCRMVAYDRDAQFRSVPAVWSPECRREVAALVALAIEGCRQGAW